MKKVALTSALILSLNISNADNEIYTVKKGDTLSSILKAKHFRHIYGKNGAIFKVVTLNPKIQKSHGSQIFPQMRIVLLKKKESAPTQESITEVKNENSPARLPSDESVSSNEFKQGFYWQIAPTISWKDLSATDETAARSSRINAISNTGYGVSFLYGMHLEENLDLAAQLQLESASFSEDSASIKLTKKSFFLSAFSFGVTLDKKWMLDLAMKDQLFLTSPTSSRIEIKKLAMPELKGAYQKQFYQYKNANFNYKLAGKIILPRSAVGLDTKLSYGLGGEVSAKLYNQSFSAGYELNFLKAKTNSTKYQNIIWKYIWETI